MIAFIRAVGWGGIWTAVFCAVMMGVSTAIASSLEIPLVVVREHLVFTPNEMVNLQIGPLPPEFATTDATRWKWSVVGVEPQTGEATGRPIASGEEPISAQLAAQTLSIPVGPAEGVVEIRIEAVAVRAAGVPVLSNVVEQILASTPAAERQFRVLVLSPESPLPVDGRRPASANRAKSLTERYTRSGQSLIVDPGCAGMAVVVAELEPGESTPASWFSVPSLSSLPSLPEFPALPSLPKLPEWKISRFFGDGQTEPFPESASTPNSLPEPPGSSMAALPDAATGPADYGFAVNKDAAMGSDEDAVTEGWDFYPLRSLVPGEFHWIEIRYTEASRRMVVCLIEPDAMLVWGVEESVEGWEPTGDGRNSLRFLFRARAAEATLAIAEFSEPVDHEDFGETPAAATAVRGYDRIRIVAAPEGIVLPTKVARAGRRLMLADLPETAMPAFTGVATTPTGVNAAADWNTVFVGGTALAEVLRMAHYDGLVWAIPTDTMQGVPAAIGAVTEPETVDSVEAMLRIFDREGLLLVLRPDFRGLGVRLGGADRSDPLSTEFQAEVLRSVREIAVRYAMHPSFGGVTVDLSPGSPMRFGMTDEGRSAVRMEEFRRETGAGEGGTAVAVDDPAWLQWRAARMTIFYAKLADTLRAVRPEARLWLLGFEPGLEPGCSTPMEAGLDAVTLAADPRFFSAVFEHTVNGNRFEPALRANAGAANAGIDVVGEIGEKSDRMAATSGKMTGAVRAGMVIGAGRSVAAQMMLAEGAGPQVVWFRAMSGPETRRLATLWAQNDIRIFCDAPFQSIFRVASDTVELLPPPPDSRVGDVSADGAVTTAANPMVNSAFAQSSMGTSPDRTLSGDSKDGVAGWATSAIFRDFPTLAAERFVSPSPSGGQPVVLRWCSDGRSTWIAAINTAPFVVRTQVRIVASESTSAEMPFSKMSPNLKGVAGRRVWDVTIPAGAVRTLRFGSAEVRIEDYTTAWSTWTDVELQRRVRWLSERVQRLASPPTMAALVNPTFAPQAGITPQSENIRTVAYETTDGNPSSVVAVRSVGNGGNGTVRSTVAGQRCFPEVPGWTIESATEAALNGGDRGEWRVDEDDAVVLRIASAIGGVTLRSEPISVPETGRLMVAVWLRAVNDRVDAGRRRGDRDDGDTGAGAIRIPSVRIGIEHGESATPQRWMTTFDHRDYGNQWIWLMVHITDLERPMGGAADTDRNATTPTVRLRIEMAGPGCVELREVQMSDVALTRAEQTMAFKRIVPAGIFWSQRRASDCLAILEGDVARWIDRYPDHH